MDESTEEITIRLSETVSDALDAPIKELPPLSQAINLDALDALVPLNSNEGSSDVVVSFTYSGLRVHVFSDKTVYAQSVLPNAEAEVVVGFHDDREHVR